jgi:hypothetical protein
VIPLSLAQVAGAVDGRLLAADPARPVVLAGRAADADVRAVDVTPDDQARARFRLVTAAGRDVVLVKASRSIGPDRPAAPLLVDPLGPDTPAARGSAGVGGAGGAS